MRALKSQPNVIINDPDYPDGRIRNNDGTGNGTGVNEAVYGDLHSNISKLMRLYDILPNGIPDSENPLASFQIVEALRGLASKNDFIYPLTTNTTVLIVDIKLAKMLVNEFIVCLAQFNKGAETQIKGDGATLFNITYSGNFKTNEYVRIVKTNIGVSIIRLADALSLDAMVNDFAYLKKANQTQENAGTIDTVATTPLTNLVAFTRRVIGADSGNYLANPTGLGARNGLMSSSDKKKLDDFDETIIGSGSVLANGTKISQRNIEFTSSRQSVGHYIITHNLGFANYGVTGSTISGGYNHVSMNDRNANYCRLELSDDNSPNDSDFAFMLFKL